MKGQLQIEGANTYASIQATDLVEAIEATSWQFVTIDGERFIYKAELPNGAAIYPELADGKLTVRYPIHCAPNFSWAKEPVDEVDISFRDGPLGRVVTLRVTASELPEEVDNFRAWALERLRLLTQQPAGELVPLLESLRKKGWLVKYSPKIRDGLIVSSKKRQPEQYVLEVRPTKLVSGNPEVGERAVSAPAWSSFIAGVTALNETLLDLTKI